jgi:hypothetical protein
MHIIILLLVLICTPESAHDRLMGPRRIVSENLISWMVPEMTRQHGKHQSAVYPIVLLSLICLLSINKNIIDRLKKRPRCTVFYLGTNLPRYLPGQAGFNAGLRSSSTYR